MPQNNPATPHALGETACPRPPLSFPAGEATRLFDRVFAGGDLGPGYAESFEIVARPSQAIDRVRAGDVVIGRRLAEAGGAEIQVSAENLPASRLGLPSGDKLVLRLREELRPFDTENLAAVGRVAAAGAGIASGVGDFIGAVDKTVEFLEKRVFNGAYRLEATAARATPYSRNVAPVAPRHSAIQFTLLAHHPRIGFSDQRFVFRVDLEADCLNIYNVSIVPNYDASSFQISSDFRIAFTPRPEQVPGHPLVVISFAISGNWDPVGLGEEAFSGTLEVRADGNMSLRINSPANWVRVGGRSVIAAAGACPAPIAPARGSTPPATITPPDGPRRPSSGGSGVPTANLIDRLPTGPTVIHVFFTTRVTRLTVNETNRLASWFNQLSPVIQEQIREGALPVYVTGHASPTGTYDANMRLSYQRAEAAASSLRSIVGPNARLLFQGVGTRDAVGGPGSNDQADRRATIRITPAAP
jgi:hypothetical protein